MTQNVTLKDVAREAGVHVSTASRALNPETRSIVNSATAARVIAVAKRLGYRPHPLARGLRTQRTLTIGMTVPDLANPIFPMIYAGAAASLAEEGYALVIGSDSLLITDHDGPDRIEEVNAILRGHYVDGWILTDAQLDSRLPPLMSDEGVPAVLVNRRANRIAAPSICSDDHLGVAMAVRHLVELGHTAIAHVAGPQNVSSGASRRQTFIETMGSEGLDVPPGLVVEADAFLATAGRAACRTLLDSGAHFTAIVAANDLIALGCYDALGDAGLDVPGSVSVTGYDDMRFIDRVDPALTTVSVPFYEMGKASGSVMLSLLSDPERMTESAEDGSLQLAPTLAVRASTGPPARTRS